MVPCYNEADRLDRRAFERLLMGDSGPTIIFVDDGSTDGTTTLLESIANVNRARCRVITSARNRGKAEAVRLGMHAALDEGAAVVGFWDADLATPLAYFGVFAALLEDRPQLDIVIGSRVRMLGRHIDRSVSRHLIGRFYATLASIVLRLPVYDTQCGAKLFRRSPALERVLATPFGSRWSFDVELLQRLQYAWGDRGLGRIIEVPLDEWRGVGRSSVSLTTGTAAFAALFSLLIRSRRSLPLRSHTRGAGAAGVSESSVPPAERREQSIGAGTD